MLEFLGVSRSNHVKKLNKLLEWATELVGGTMVQSPFSALLGQEITVHPVGYVTSHYIHFIDPDLKSYRH